MDKNIRVISFSYKFINITLEKRIFGFMMTVLGIIGFLLASYHITQVPTRTNHPVLSFTVYCILGLVFFFAGIGMMRSTRDLTTQG